MTWNVAQYLFTCVRGGDPALGPLNFVLENTAALVLTGYIWCLFKEVKDDF